MGAAGLVFRAALRAYQPPCEALDSATRCRHWEGCQRFHMACQAFVDFSLGKRATNRRLTARIPARVPSRALYQQLYQEQETYHDVA